LEQGRIKEEEEEEEADWLVGSLLETHRSGTKKNLICNVIN
jgi:hypothetical protein